MSDSQFARVVRRFAPDGRFISAKPLDGGVSAQVTRIEFEQPNGQRNRWVIRQHGARDLVANPHIARDEFRLLRALHAADIPVPKMLHLDESGEIFATPYLVLQFVEGRITLPTPQQHALDQMAAVLARLHSLTPHEQDFTYLKPQSQHLMARLLAEPNKVDEHLRERRIRAVLAANSPIAAHNAEALLHGDYWPGNVLWHEARLAAIIDWEDATRGDPLADLANSRFEILWTLGVDAMRHYTASYRARMPHLDATQLPYWDLYAALRPIAHISDWAASAAAEQQMRERHRWFTSQAFAALE